MFVDFSSGGALSTRGEMYVMRIIERLRKFSDRGLNFKLILNERGSLVNAWTPGVSSMGLRVTSDFG